LDISLAIVGRSTGTSYGYTSMESVWDIIVSLLQPLWKSNQID